MKIRLTTEFAKTFAEAQKASLPQLSRWLTERTGRYGEDTVTLDTAAKFDEGLTPIALEDLVYGFAKEHKNQSVMMFIGGIRLALKDVKRSKPGSLAALQAALCAYFQEDAIDGWLYVKNDADEKFLAYVINKIHLEIPTKSEKDNGAKDRLVLSYTANSTTSSVSRGSRSYRSHRGDNGTQYNYVFWEWGNFNKKTVPDLLAEKGIFHESPELKADYERQLGIYREYRPMYAQQFVGAAGAYEEVTGEVDNERNRGRDLSAVSFYINDDMDAKRPEFAEERDNTWWTEQGAAENLFARLPMHPYLKMFNLGTHEFGYLHVDSVRPYVYDPTLRDKIVLPEHHRDLIEVLVEDLGAVAGDVVTGKGGGTSILCQGRSGLGKTLTAEIYSEVGRKPLYRVHSGQLGTGPKQVEQSLKAIFGRAQRWGCILLLDEADVYIRRRGDDLEHNAVVACFLRTMEYFSGIFFMTTNREDDVDDAIASRCLAIITYEMPKAGELRRIFQIHADRLGGDLSDDELDKLTGFYAGKLSGRDAKTLLELAARYASKKSERLSAETVRKLAQFKGF